MKRKYAVTITKWVEIEYHPDLNQDEMVKEFSEYIYKVDDFDELSSFVATQIAKYEGTFIEGIGKCDGDYEQGFQPLSDDQPVLLYRTDFEDVEVEEIKR